MASSAAMIPARRATPSRGGAAAVAAWPGAVGGPSIAPPRPFAVSPCGRLPPAGHRRTTATAVAMASPKSAGAMMEGGGRPDDVDVDDDDVDVDDDDDDGRGDDEEEDTIFALSSGGGGASLGSCATAVSVVRVSGPRAFEALRELLSPRAAMPSDGEEGGGEEQDARRRNCPRRGWRASEAAA